MATTTTNFGWDIPQSTDLVKDGATAIAALGQDIDTALVDLKGGTTGQILSKASGTDLDFTWVAQDDSNAIQNAIVDAKGDLIAATAADTPARLAVGANGYVLTADSTQATGIKWAAPASSGKILQVVQGSASSVVTINGTTYADSGLSATITPTSATSKVLAIVAQNTQWQSASSQASNFYGMKLLRGATTIVSQTGSGTNSLGLYISTVSAIISQSDMVGFSYLDSPATTSATTYKTQFAHNQSGGQLNLNSPTALSTLILLEVGA